VQEALEAFQAQQEAFLKNLDRTIALLKRLRQEQALDALVRQMEALSARAGGDRAGPPGGGGRRQRLSEREETLRRDAEAMREGLARAAERWPTAALQGRTWAGLAG